MGAHRPRTPGVPCARGGNPLSRIATPGKVSARQAGGLSFAQGPLKHKGCRSLSILYSKPARDRSCETAFRKFQGLGDLEASQRASMPELAGIGPARIRFQKIIHRIKKGSALSEIQSLLR